jgi:hypothetical protein
MLPSDMVHTMDRLTLVNGKTMPYGILYILVNEG